MPDYEDFKNLSDRDLIILYSENPTTADGKIAKEELEYRKYKASKLLAMFSLVLAGLMAIIAALQIYYGINSIFYRAQNEILVTLEISIQTDLPPNEPVLSKTSTEISRPTKTLSPTSTPEPTQLMAD